MAYEALARKYRPRNFEEVVGQEPIVKTLGNALREKRIHHAYVFSGVRGVGKTTIARVFAKALNCEKGPTPTPCLACDACVEIAAGRDLDVIEMDAASRTGVDDVRDLIDTTRYAPARDRYKVFIIDEFHMLSKPAFNALLKTLEEPPPRVVFVMATTELHKVLPTVLSRTQQFDFRKVAVREIADQLAMIAKKEKVKAPRAAFEMLARAADGSVRDATSLLDQAIAFCGSELGEAEVRTLLGLVPEEMVEGFLASVAGKDAGALVRTIAAALAEGHDLRLFHAGLIEGVRRLLVLKAVPPSAPSKAAGAPSNNPSEILGLSQEDEARLATLAEGFTTDALLRAFSVLAALEAPLKYSDQPRYLLEAAAIRLAAITELAPIEDLIARLDAGGPYAGPPARPASIGASAPSRPAPAAPAPPPPAPAPSGRSGGPARRTRGEEESPAGASDAGSTRDADDEPPPPTDADLHGPPARLAAPPSSSTSESSLTAPTAPEGGMASFDAPEIGRILARLRETKEALAMLVEHAAAVLLEGRRIVVVFDDSQTFLRKNVEQPANAAILKSIATEVLGAGASIEVRRGAAPKRPASARIESAPPDGASGEVGEGAAAIESVREPGPPDAYPLFDEPEAATAGEADDQPLLIPDPGAAPRIPGPGAAPAAPAPSAGARAASASRRAPEEPLAAAPSDPAPPQGATGARYQRLHAQALEDPIVKNLVSRFGGRIVEIKEVP